MSTKKNLLLHEEVLLLALHDEKGTISGGSMYPYAIGGAVLAELLLAGRVEAESTKKALANVVSSKKVGDPLIDEWLGKMKAARRRGSLQTWVSRIANTSKLKHRVAAELCKKGVLRADEDKILLLFTRKIYPETNPVPERQLMARLDRAVFGQATEIDPRTVVLLSLANQAGLLRLVMDKRKLKAKRKRIEQIVNGELTGKATKEAIAAMQQAVMVACIIPAIVATTVTSSH